MTGTAQMLLREEALAMIAARIKERTHYVLLVAPPLLGVVLDRLDERKTVWWAFAENGTSAVMHTDVAAGLLLPDLLGIELGVVITVPKSVRTKDLSYAIGNPVPKDGSQDLMVVAEPDGQFFWPVLFIDALDEVDPVSASQIRASEVPRRG